MSKLFPVVMAIAAVAAVTLLAVALAAPAAAQNAQGATSLRGVPGLPPPARPVVLYTAEQPRIRVVPVAAGFSHPWSFAFPAETGTSW